MNSSYDAHLHSFWGAQDHSDQEEAGRILPEASTYGPMVVEDLAEALIVLDQQWRVISFINHEPVSSMQKMREELLGRDFWEAFPELAGSLFYQRCQQVAASGEAAHIEIEFSHSHKWFHIHVFPSLAGITIFPIDITAQKRGEAQLQFQANILRYVQDSIIVTDLQGKITYWNEGASSIFGYTSDEVIGQTIAWIYPEPDAALLIRDIQPIAGGQDYSGEWQGRRKDGAAVWVEVKTTQLRDAEGELCGLIGLAKDITARKHLEEELQRSKDQLEVILQNVEDGIIVQDASGRIVYANLEGALRVGYTSVEEMLLAPPLAYLERFDVYDEQGQPFPPSRLPGRRAMQGEKNPQANLRYVDKQTGEVHWSLIKSTAVLEADQTPFLVISVLQDITHFKELEQRKDEFIMHVSHELRTPLTALSGFLELLKNYYPRLDASTKETFLSRAIENCRELTYLVNSILDVVYFKQEVNPAQFEKLSLSSVVQEIQGQLNPRLAQEFTLRLAIPEQLVVWADRQYLQLVLRNLIMNAFKYAPKQTAVVVSAAPDENPAEGTSVLPQLCVSVQDAGPGIPPAEQAHLFEQFSRLKRDFASSVRGTGLGLHVSKQLVERMGGRIWVESTGQVGEGSRFCFTLPVASSESLS